VARNKHRKKSKPGNSHNFINAEAIKTCSTGNSNNSGHNLCICSDECWSQHTVSSTKYKAIEPGQRPRTTLPDRWASNVVWNLQQSTVSNWPWHVSSLATVKRGLHWLQSPGPAVLQCTQFAAHAAASNTPCSHANDQYS